MAATDGRFDRIRQVATFCPPPVWAYWRYLANTIEIFLPSAHPSSQPKRQINRFSHFCTAHGRNSLYFTVGDSFPQNWPFSWGSGVWTSSDSWLLGPFWAHNPNGISIGSAVFAQMTAKCPYTLQLEDVKNINLQIRKHINILKLS